MFSLNCFTRKLLEVLRAIAMLLQANMQELGKIFVALGILLTFVGITFWSGFGRNWLGRLPGDIHVSRENLSFHFPIATCLLLSACFSILLWLLNKLK